MNLTKTALTAAALLAGAIALPGAASALTANPAVQAPSVAESVACRIVRERVVTPSGRIIYRSSRVCTPTVYVPPVVVRRPACTTIKERTVTPSGRVIVRTVRRCG